MTPEARRGALAILALNDPLEKAAQARALFAGLTDAAIDPDAQLTSMDPLPGRPARPRLVPAKDVPTRSPFTPEGRAALLHAVTHIEFNAIKTALDFFWSAAVQRSRSCVWRPWVTRQWFQ